MLFFIEKHKPARTVSGGLVMSASCQDSLGNKSDLLEQVDEAITITYSEVSQDLTVELDTVLDHRCDERGVGGSSIAARCRDTGDPQAAEVALLVAAVTVCKVSSTCNGFVCSLKNVLTGAEVTFGELDNLLVTLLSHHTTFNTRHFSYPFGRGIHVPQLGPVSQAMNES